MKNKNIQLILVLIATFLITNGTFFVLCEEDAILNYINRVGNWTKADLWHSAYIFGFYKLADYAYNLDYLVPRILHSLAPVKWVDKLNGYLGFSSKGELEQYLASHSYQPLYKDAISSFNSHVSIPFYNNWYGPLVGIAPKPPSVIHSIPEPIVFELRRETTIQRNRVQVVEKHDEDILALRDEIQRSRASLDDLALSQRLNINNDEILREIKSLSRYEEAVTYTTSQLSRAFVGYDMFMADEDRGAELIPYKLKCMEFHRSYNAVKIFFDHPHNLSINVPFTQFSQNFPLISNYVSKIILPIRSQREDISSDGIWRIIDLSDWVYIELDYITTKHSWYKTTFEIVPESCTFKTFGGQATISKLSENMGRRDDFGMLVDKIKSDLMEAVSRDQTNFDMQLATMETTFANYLQRNNPQDDTISAVDSNIDADNQENLIVDGSIFSETTQLLPAIAVGSLTTLTVGQALVVFSYFFGIETFQTFIQTNLHVQEALINLYISNNLEVPSLISDTINNSPTVTNVPANFEPNSPISSVPSINGTSAVQYIGYGIALVGAVGLTWYLTKYGMDASPVVETAKTFKESLQEKYVNFK